VRFDPIRLALAVARAGVALVAVVLLVGCASQHEEAYGVAQCEAMGGSLVRQLVDQPQGRQPGFRVETQKCVFPTKQSQSP